MYNLIQKLGLGGIIRIPSIFFVNEEEILLESLFDYKPVEDYKGKEIHKKFRQLPIHEHYELTDEHCFVTCADAKNPKFVIIDPCDGLFKGNKEE